MGLGGLGALFATTLDAYSNVPPDIRDITIWLLATVGAVGTIILAFLRLQRILGHACLSFASQLTLSLM